MTKRLPLNLNELTINPKIRDSIKSTNDVPSFISIIDQKRAQKSIDLGLHITKKEYNIFISGHSGTGKTSYIINKIEEYAKTQKPPSDWCYVYNFEDEISPMALSLNAGCALDFKEDISDFINYLIKYVPIYFNSQSYEKEKNKLLNKYEQLIIEATDKLYECAKEKGFAVQESQKEGFLFIPLDKSGKEMSSETYNKISKEEKKLINDNLSNLRLTSLEVLKDTKIIEKNIEEELLILDNTLARAIIDKALKNLREKYRDNKKILRYFELLKNDLVKNIEIFMDDEIEGANEKNYANFLKRYEVSIITSNDPSKGAPVIFEDLPDTHNLLGKIEYENTGTHLITDFSLIRSGSLHKANGGYLIINACDILSTPDAWTYLKRALKSQSITIEGSKNNFDFLPLLSLTPESIPLDVKVILIGSDMFYSLLLSYDPEFKKLFKIKAEFDSEVPNDEDTITEIIGYLSNYITRKKFKHVHRDGILELLRYSSRLAESKKFFSSSISNILDIIDIANVLAVSDNSEFITKEHILLALEEINAMHSLYKKKVLDLYKDGTYLCNLSGTRVGEINGLSVSDYGDCILGQQHKITANTYVGKAGVISIERECENSGPIHNKGVSILSSFLGEWLSQEIPVSFNGTIVFEQLYSGIEGDSASAAELIALISSLSNVPIKQGFAITGSINQKGYIQPIGGVNDKIEGFFHICNLFDIKEPKGVIIPKTNINNVILPPKVLDACDKGEFFIFSTETLEDCLYLLLDESFVKENEDNLMEALKIRIMDRLLGFHKVLNS